MTHTAPIVTAGGPTISGTSSSDDSDRARSGEHHNNAVVADLSSGAPSCVVLSYFPPIRRSAQSFEACPVDHDG